MEPAHHQVSGLSLTMAWIAIAIGFFLNYYKASKIQKHAGYTLTSTGSLMKAQTHDKVLWNIQPSKLKPMKKAKDEKNYLNSLSQKEFDRVKMLGVPHEVITHDKPSKAYFKIEDLDSVMKLTWGGSTVVDLFSGRGGWSQYAYERGARVTSYSWWTGRHYEEWRGPDVARVDGDLRKNRRFYKCNVLLADGGESYKDFDHELVVNRQLLYSVDGWMREKPDHFVVRVQTPHDPEVIAKLEEWQQITGKGALVRLSRERLSSTNLYFVSFPKKDLKETVAGFYQQLATKRRVAETSTERVMYYEKLKPIWEKESQMEAPDLPALDMSKSIAQMHMNKPPIGITRFFVELGYRCAPAWGCAGSVRNRVVMGVLRGLTDILFNRHQFGAWDMTSTTPAAVYDIFKRKVDKAPVENHQHFGGLSKVYQALGETFHGVMHRLSDYSIITGINRKGAMGYQMSNKGYGSLGEYVDVGPWREDEEAFMKSLREGRPIWAVFNSIAKKEKKKNFSREKRGSRLIQYLPGPARIAEMRLLGGLHEFLAAKNWTVTGRRLTDYGDIIYGKKEKHPYVVSEDIAGWDTTISKGVQRLEARTLMAMAEDERHRKDILNLYRVYANPHVVVQRDWYGETHDVLYKGRGQVSSGRQPTYACNTITNCAITFYTIMKSLDIPEGDWPRQMKLFDRGEAAFDMLISGDDKLVFFRDRDDADKYAQEAYKITNDMGMLRKDMPKDQPSAILEGQDEIWFCSHTYSKVRYREDTKYMPLRSVGEILAKACFAIGSYRDEATAEAWARVQGLSLLVNYHHIPEIRMVAYAILSSTRVGLNLQGLSLGWNISREWLHDDLPIEIISNVLFNDSRLQHYSDLGYIDYKERMSGLTIKPGEKNYKRWKRGLLDDIDYIRERQPGTYKDWMHHVKLFTQK